MESGRCGSDNVDKPMNSNSHSAPTEWSHGISDYLSVRSSEQIYTCPLGLLNWYTSHGIVFQTLVFVLSLSILLWLGHSLSELKRFPWSFDLLRIFGRRADYLNREKLVTLFKHFRGILSLKKFLEAFLELLDPSVSPLSWELDSEENESEEPLFSLFTPKYLPQFFLTLILS